jgi:hypothetical protein
VSFLAPLFFVGLAALAIPVFVHLIQRERRTVVPFPSLMFIRRIPYQSVERRRIHNWPLLLVRAAALALIVAAFARPFFHEDPVKAAAAATGARDVVILLDHSASMAYGNHWTRAQEEARRIVGTLDANDRATLVLFDDSVEEAVRATSDRGALTAGINAAAVTAHATRYAPALREVESLFGRSDRARKEAYFISDFQKSGWAEQEQVRLPPGATITPVSVAELETADVAVTGVGVARASFSGEERVTLTASLVNRGGEPVHVPVVLEIDGRAVGTKEATVAPRGSSAVTFDTFTLAEANARGVIHAGTDALPADNDFYFVLSPSRPLSVLVLQPNDASADASLYLATGLRLSQTPPFTVETVAESRATPASLNGRTVVVVNDATALSSPMASALQRFVTQGGGLFLVVANNTPVGNGSPILPGTLGGPVDRLSVRGGTLGYLDYSHPIFEAFKDPRNGSFADIRFLRYRTLAPAPTDHVLARYDDGAAAMVERRVGSGRVIAFTSTIDGDWNDYPKHGMFVPIIHETMKYLAQYTAPQAWYTVGRMFDIATPIAAMVQQGQVSGASGAARDTAGVVVTPGGRQVTIGGGGSTSIALDEAGFYAVRLPGMAAARPYIVAVNMDRNESDLVALAPAEFLASATGQTATVAAGESYDRNASTPEDVEKRQSIWWYLLVAGLAALLIETAWSNRLSRQRTPRTA